MAIEESRRGHRAADGFSGHRGTEAFSGQSGASGHRGASGHSGASGVRRGTDGTTLRRIAPALLLAVAAVLVLISQYVVDPIAGTSEAWHWIQHGMVFLGGGAAGSAVTLLYSASRSGP